MEIIFYFCKPCHSWECGANENTNGLIWQYIPKGTDFSDVTEKKIKYKRNNPPRKRLGYLTPNEKIKQIINPNTVALSSLIQLINSYIDMNRTEFIALIKETDSDIERIVRKHIFHGTPVVFNSREDDYFDFRNQIASHFGVSFHEVFIVGSAKLGFSCHKDSEFSLESDIDVVIVNEKLFEEFYLTICKYQYELDNSLITITLDESKEYNRFLRYLIKGWMRPDKLPAKIQAYINKGEWFNFFTSISYNKSCVGNYKVAAGLYKNYMYLEKYHINSLNKIK